MSTEVNVSEVSSEVTFEPSPGPRQTPAAEEGPEAIQRAEAMRAKARRIASRTSASGFED